MPALVTMFLQQNIDTFQLDNQFLSPFHSVESEIVLQDGMAFKFARDLNRYEGKTLQINMLQL